jgi:thiol-disulfide isomerase/thioredoxin
MRLLLITFFLLFSIPNYLFGQKRFALTIELPDKFQTEKLKIFLDNGKGQVLANPVVKDNKLFLDGEYYSEYAAIILRYPQYSNLDFGNSFFITEKPGYITLLKTDSTQSPFEKYRLKDVFDFATEKKKMMEFDSSEKRNSEEYFAKNMDKIFGNEPDSTISKEFFRLDQLIYRKALEYILQNSNSYYSFWFFRRNIAPGNVIPVDSALQMFNKIFPDKFKFSEEGEFASSFMLGRINVSKGGYAPIFNSKDINGTIISLKDMIAKKYVLLTFWATWCVPCIKEIPALQDIYKNYGEGVAVISVSYESNYSKYVEMVNKEKMSWTNIYNDVDLINSYGGYLGIPRTFLIDHTGKIIYQAFVDDFDDAKLSNLQKLLAKIALNK